MKSVHKMARAEPDGLTCEEFNKIAQLLLSGKKATGIEITIPVLNRIREENTRKNLFIPLAAHLMMPVKSIADKEGRV
ncbi:MAG: hypothetical protein Q8941_16355 [Bacteroidota bacterium]|nr:hypothetical protein [Bacteroidota bacterium]